MPSNDNVPLVAVRPVDITDADLFPEFALARRYLALKAASSAPAEAHHGAPFDAGRDRGDAR